jgi:hypothetical protein
MCPIFQTKYEACYYFSAGCLQKYHLWIYALNQLDVEDLCNYQAEIWNTLTFNQPQYLNSQGLMVTSFSVSQVTAVETIYSVIWSCNYQSILKPVVYWCSENDETIASKAISSLLPFLLS